MTEDNVAHMGMPTMEQHVVVKPAVEQDDSEEDGDDRKLAASDDRKLAATKQDNSDEDSESDEDEDDFSVRELPPRVKQEENVPRKSRLLIVIKETEQRPRMQETAEGSVAHMPRMRPHMARMQVSVQKNAATMVKQEY
jgi:hypothetical protein